MIEPEFLELVTSGSPITAAEDRFFAVRAPDGVLKPYVTFFEVSSAPVTSLGGDSGLDNVRLQVDVWADTYEEAREVSKGIRALISGASFKPTTQDKREDYESDTKLYRVSTDYACWDKDVI